MAVRQLPAPKWTVPGLSGKVASGWQVFTYIPGTTEEKDTYSDKDATTPNSNPVVLDSRGEADIWWDGNYKVVVKDQNDVTVWTVDNYGEGLDPEPVAQLSLLKNYSFESATADPDTPDDWDVSTYTDGTATLDTAVGNQIHGATALKFTSVGTGGGFAESAIVPVQEALSLTVSVAMKSSVADVRNVVEMLWYDRNQNLLSTTSLYDDSTTNPTSWTDKDFTATPPSTARYAKIRLTGCHSSDSTTGSTWFDNVRVGSAPGSDLVTLNDTQTLTNKTLQDYGEKVNAIGSIGGGTQDIDLSLGNVVSATVDTSETTFTFSNPFASGTASSFTLFLTNGGSQTVNWPASVDWAGGVAPTLTAAGVDVLVFATIDGGTTWYGFVSGQDMS